MKRSVIQTNRIKVAHQWVSWKVIALLCFELIFLNAQNINAQQINQKPDTSSLRYAIQTGTTEGHFRYFLSQTTNEGSLTDYIANALGGGLRYQTNVFHHFKFTIGMYTVFNLYSSNLLAPDSMTGAANRYEIGLFDGSSPVAQREFYRQEELALSYLHKKGKLILGRQFIQTPLINVQDGRMRGTAVSGIWIDHQLKNTLKFQGGLLNAFSPRGTTQWYQGASSIGLYSQGLTVFGTPAQFKGNIHMPFVGVTSIIWKPTKNFSYQVWDYHMPQLLNTTYQQIDFSSQQSKWQNSFQFLRQWALSEGGNPDPAQTYITKGAKSLSFGLRTKVAFAQWHYSLAYNRCTSEGRYLFPREWGRDPFFTFMPRERNEGYGDVTALVAKIEFQQKASMLAKSSFAFGYFQMPDVKNYTLNKYGMPSYLQANLDLKMSLNTLIHGLEGQLLLVAKYGIGETYGNPKFQINKVNMLLTNFVLTYHFQTTHGN